MDPATIAALSAGGGAVLGGLMGNQEQFGPGDAMPNWLEADWRQLGSTIADMPVPEYYQGQLIADQNPWMQNALGGMAGWGSGLGGNMMGNMYGAGLQGLGGIGAGMNYANMLQSQGPNQFAYDQGTYNQVMGNLMPGTQNAFNVNAANQQRNFDFNVLPGLKMNAALGGGYGGTKAGQQSDLAAALNASNIQNMGVNLWQNAANQANQGGMMGGQLNLGAANQMNNQLLNAYGQYGQLGGNLMNQAYNMGIGNLGMGLKAGQLQQAYDQSLIDADKAKWDFEQNAGMNHLTNQLALMKAQGLGGPPTTTGMSTAEGIMQGLMGGLGIYGMGKDAGWWGV